MHTIYDYPAACAGAPADRPSCPLCGDYLPYAGAPCPCDPDAY